MAAVQMNLFALHAVSAISNLLPAGYWTKLAIKILISDTERG